VEGLERTNRASPLEELFAGFERNNRELLRYETLLDAERRELIDIVCSNFSVSGKSSTFALRTPYREIAELDDLPECAHHRDDVRTKRIFDVLKNIAENEIVSVSYNVPQVPKSLHRQLQNEHGRP
jgi:hypothetical protein